MNEDRDTVLELVRKYGNNSMSYLSLEEDKTWFFSESVEGVASYAVSHGVMIVCGDPVCAPEDLAAFLKELRRFCAHKRYEIVFLFALPENLPIYRKLGFAFAKGGEEAVFRLAEYDLKGGKVAKVRAAINHAVKAGLTVREYDPRSGKSPELEGQFDEVSREWLAAKSTSRLQFALGGVGFDYPNDKRYFYAADESGAVQGFMVFLPYMGGNGYMADVTRRRADAPYGVMELIFYEGFMKLRDEGVELGSLGVAPLADTGEEPSGGFFAKISRYIFENMNEIYGFKPLFHAKAKYAPTFWKPLYITYLPRLLTPRMGYAMVDVLDTEGFHDYVVSFIENHKKKQRIESFDGYVQSGSANIYYTYTRPAADPEARCLVLLHGNHLSQQSFARVRKSFEKEYRVLLIDSRGHGKSTFGRKGLNFDMMADDTKKVMETLGIEKADIIGFSDGANLAASVAVRYPALTRSLVLVSGNMNPGGMIAPFHHSVKLIQIILKPLSAAGRKIRMESERFGLMGSHPHITDEELGGIKCPVLLIQARFDLIKRKHMEHTKRQIPSAETFIVPWSTHMSFLRNKKPYRDAISSFLKRNGQ